MIAVGIAEHHFLHAAAALQQANVFRQREQRVHDLCAVAQIADSLEQRHDIEVELALEGMQQARLLEHHCHFKEVGDAVRLGDHVVRHRIGTVTLAQRGGGANDGEFAGGLVRIRNEARRERTRGPQLGRQ